MTNHLPECPTEVVYDITSSPLVMTIYDELHCICDRLRACEQRVREEERGGAPVAAIELAGYTRGYGEALDAARKAVAALIVFPQPVAPTLEDALGAINALREGNK